MDGETRHATNSLVQLLAQAGGALNSDKQVTVPRFVGPGAFKGSRAFTDSLRGLPGTVSTHAKYLGV
eukprot:1038830-Pyramimonas_sp.AAC.1